MKNNNLCIVWILIVSLLILILSIIMLVFIHKINLKVSDNDNKKLNLRTLESLNCDYKPNLYYSADDYNIYSYCLDSISVIDDYTMELKEYILDNPNVLESLFENMTFATYLDGGTREYKDYKIPNISNNGITIIKCNGRDDKTKDVYIGPDTMYYKSNFCKQDNSTFTKVFKVLDVDKGFLHEVTLTLEYLDSSYMVTIDSIEDFQVGSNYEFEFMGEDTNDTINSIFKDFRIVEIRKVNNN